MSRKRYEGCQRLNQEYWRIGDRTRGTLSCILARRGGSLSCSLARRRCALSCSLARRRCALSCSIAERRCTFSDSGARKNRTTHLIWRRCDSTIARHGRMNRLRWEIEFIGRVFDLRFIVADRFGRRHCCTETLLV